MDDTRIRICRTPAPRIFIVDMIYAMGVAMRTDTSVTTAEISSECQIALL